VLSDKDGRAPSYYSEEEEAEEMGESEYESEEDEQESGPVPKRDGWTDPNQK